MAIKPERKIKQRTGLESVLEVKTVFSRETFD